jgi:hypothetical protein
MIQSDGGLGADRQVIVNERRPGWLKAFEWNKPIRPPSPHFPAVGNVDKI